MFGKRCREFNEAERGRKKQEQMGLRINRKRSKHPQLRVKDYQIFKRRTKLCCLQDLILGCKWV